MQPKVERDGGHTPNMSLLSIHPTRIDIMTSFTSVDDVSPVFIHYSFSNSHIFLLLILNYLECIDKRSCEFGYLTTIIKNN